ncbi:MAG: hypothetical protein NVS9B14_08600 [Candidatus Acidiferrum sp.]
MAPWRALAAPAVRVLKFHLLEKSIETLEVGFPELAITLDPTGGFGERLRREAAGAALAVASARDETGAFEDEKMLRNGWLAHGKGPGEFKDTGFAAGESGKNRAARWIGESGECGVETVSSSHCITRKFYNQMVIYRREAVKNYF